MKRILKAVLAGILVTAVPLTLAGELVIGQVAPIQNPDSPGSQLKAGIELYFDVVNAQGGVRGNRLRLVSQDRGLKASEAVSATRELVQKHKPTALIGLLGTGPMEALVKERMFAEMGIPVVGVRTGATSLHEPLNPWLFHTRASYRVEARKIVQHLAPIGFRRFAIFYEDTEFGREGLQHAEMALADAKLPPVAKAAYKKGQAVTPAAVKLISDARPDAVIAIGDSTAVADFYRQLKQAGGRPQVVSLSTVDAVAVVKHIGEEIAYGLGIAQVVPDPLNRKTPVVRQYQDHVAKLRPAGFVLSQAGLEGYIAAKVLVEGLRRSSDPANPVQLRVALETLQAFDVGGMTIDFSPRQRSGTSYVNIGIIGPKGRILQ